MTGRQAVTVPPLFARLVDDAGLFPPEELAMSAALARHLHDAAAGNPILTGRFLCPAARLDELVALLPAGEAALTVGLIAPLHRPVLEVAIAALDPDRVSLAGVEGPLGDIGALGAVPTGIPCFVELPITGDWRDDLARVADAGHAAKVRCGGLRAELFPTADALGRFVHHCAVRGHVAFKATAGLHRALPYRDERRGFDHHGFLNLLLGAARAAGGADAAAVIEVLRQRDADTLITEAAALTAEQAAAARRLFVAYGSCSTSEPLDDLRTLGLVADQPTVPA